MVVTGCSVAEFWVQTLLPTRGETLGTCWPSPRLDSMYFKGMVKELNELLFLRYTEQCLAQSEYLIGSVG